MQAAPCRSSDRERGDEGRSCPESDFHLRTSTGTVIEVVALPDGAAATSLTEILATAGGRFFLPFFFFGCL